MVTVSAPVQPAGEGYVIDANVIQSDHVRTGDSIGNDQYRGILSFDLGGIGPVEQAVLTFHRLSMVGNPWGMGPLEVDHIDGGGLLDNGDAVDAALESAFESLANQPTWTIDVTAQVAADVEAGRTTSTFRLRFDLPSDFDGGFDYMNIGASGIADPADRPTLMITHAAP